MNPIKALEDIDQVLPHDKASILLVYAGLKPSCLAIFSGEVYDQTKDEVHIDAGILNIFKQILDALHLHYQIETKLYENEGENETNAQEVVRAFISKDKDTANKLKIYFDDLDKYDYEAGILLGYPETAVMSFLTPNMLAMEDEPIATKYVSEVNMRLLGYRLSKDQWEDEVKPLEAQGNYLKELSPKIYSEVTQG